MKVLLNSDMGRLGRKGDLVEVAPGYARNFLLPKNLAIAASKGALKQGQVMQRSRRAQDLREKADFEALAQRIGELQLRIAARAGAAGTLFGSVTTSEIANELGRALGIEVDRRKVAVSEPIKSLGTHSFKISLHPQVVAEGTVEVVSDGVTPDPVEEPAPPAEAKEPSDSA